MYSRCLCFMLAGVFGCAIFAEERGKKDNTGLVAYCLTNSSSNTVKLVLFYGKQKNRKTTEITIEQRHLASAPSKKSKLGSTAVTFSLIGGPNGKDLEFAVYDSSNNKLGSKGVFVEQNTPPNNAQGDTIDSKDERINIGVNPSNQVFFSINPKP